MEYLGVTTKQRFAYLDAIKPGVMLYFHILFLHFCTDQLKILSPGTSMKVEITLMNEWPPSHGNSEQMIKVLALNQVFFVTYESH